MTVYIICLVMALLLCNVLNLLTPDRAFKNAISCILLGVLLAGILGMRHPNMGIDLGYYRGYGYLESFQVLQRMSWGYILHLPAFLNYEFGYIWFNKFVSIFGSSPQTLLIGCSICSLLPIMYVFYKESTNVPFSYAIYIGLPCFIFLFSGLRQGIAIGLCFFSYLYIEKKRGLAFVVCILLATAFHKTALLCLCMYPFYYFTMQRKLRLWITLPMLAGVFILRVPLFAALSHLVKSGGRVAEHNGSVTFLLVIVAIYILCSLLAKNDSKTNGLLNLVYCACLCQCFGEIYQTAIRLGYYFMIFFTLLLPYTVNQLRNRPLGLFIKCITIGCFLSFAMWQLYTTSWAMAYPYSFFWQ